MKILETIMIVSVYVSLVSLITNLYLNYLVIQQFSLVIGCGMC